MGTAKSGVPIKTVRMAGQIVSRGSGGNNEDTPLQGASPANMKKIAGGSQSLKSSVEALACTRAAGKLAVANTTYAPNLFVGGL